MSIACGSDNPKVPIGSPISNRTMPFLTGFSFYLRTGHDEKLLGRFMLAKTNLKKLTSQVTAILTEYISGEWLGVVV